MIGLALLTAAQIATAPLITERVFLKYVDQARIDRGGTVCAFAVYQAGPLQRMTTCFTTERR